MRHIWICLIDGVIVRSGPIQPTDTMPMVLERLMRVYPHMQTESLKVIREDGLIFDSELSFSNPSPNDPNRPDVDEVLATVGVVEGHLGVQIYHGKSPEDILVAEAKTFPEIITEQMDFGIFNFAGDQLISIEDMITYLGPQCVPDFQPKENRGGGSGGGNNRNSNNRGRNRRPLRRRGRGQGPSGPRNQNKPEGSAEAGQDQPNPAGSSQEYSDQGSGENTDSRDNGGDERSSDTHSHESHENCRESHGSDSRGASDGNQSSQNQDSRVQDSLGDS